MIKRRVTIQFAIAAAALAMPLTAFSAGDPVIGGRLYQNTNGAPLSCANAACHGPSPAANVNGITRAADNPALILNAISSAIPVMSFLSQYVNAVDAEHIAAYIANPNGLPSGSIGLSSNTLAFGDQVLSIASGSQTVTVTNSGSNAVTLSAIANGGVHPNDFTRTGTCASGTALAAGATCTVVMTFTPGALGARSGLVAIVHSGVSSPAQVNMSGNGTSVAGAVMSLSANALTFAGQALTTTSAAQTITVSNTGPLAMSLSGVSIGGANAADFVRGGSCASGTSLLTGQSCSVTVAFAPTAIGTRNGAVSITSNAPGSPHSIAVTATGNPAPAPEAAFSSNSMLFGNYVIGTTSPPKTITLTNTGTLPLNITSIANPAAPFAMNTTCGAALAVGASCTINATYTPSTATLAAATINIVTNANGSPHNISLSGMGFDVGTNLPPVTLSPASVGFGMQTVNTASPGSTITLTNTGSAPLVMTNLNFTGVNAAEFTRAGTCAVSVAVAAGGSCTLIITFTPTATGARSATLNVISNALGQPSIPLTGTGMAPPPPVVTLQMNTIAFADQRTGTASAPQVVLLTNTGSGALPITSITTGGDFSLTHTCGSSRAPTASCQIAVTFSPTATGARTGQVTIVDGAAGSPHRIDLSGNGISTSASPAGATSGGGGGGGCAIGSGDDVDPILALLVFAALLALRRRSRRHGLL